MTRFSFPEVCCRCVADEPANSWPVQSYDSKPGPGNTIVSITYTCQVPVCARCHRSLTFLWSVCWFAALCLGATAGWFIYQYAIDRPEAHRVPELVQKGMPILLGGVIAMGAAWLLKGVFINYDFVHFDSDQQTMVFKNQQYQAAFDAMNHHPAGRSFS